MLRPPRLVGRYSRRLRASHLITPSRQNERELGVLANAFADVLARHVKVTGIDDVLTFCSTC